MDDMVGRTVENVGRGVESGKCVGSLTRTAEGNAVDEVESMATNDDDKLFGYCCWFAI